MLIVSLIVAAVVGLFTGALARLALPGKDPLSLFQTMLVGVAGGVIATLVVYLATGGKYGAGWFASFVVSVLIVYVIRKRRGGGLTDPGVPPTARR
jgi:uncharacterized membrane protein YeaQ/YmgE (transglycosylase-associated protein family)